MPAHRFDSSLFRIALISLVSLSACEVVSSGSKSANNKNGATAAAAESSSTAIESPDEVAADPGLIDTTAELDTSGAAVAAGAARALDSAATATTTTGNTATAAAPRTREDTLALLRTITPAAVATRPSRLPLRPETSATAAMQAQILLDRANFSPGILSGVWGPNAARAVRWFQVSRGLDSTGVIDRATYDSLVAASGLGQNGPMMVKYQVTSADLAGPFVKIPTSVYAQAKLPCLCYTSAAEELGERFHVTPAMLSRLNGGMRLDALRAGTTLTVPNVARDTAAPPPYQAAQLVVSKTEFWTNVLDSAGHVVAHYPSTLGADYDPSPSGQFTVTDIVRHPKFHYQPVLLDQPASRPDAHLPKGPNSPVGVVWIALSKPHYGIHGTSEPTTIGLTESHGCVRLTNWDAWTLAGAVHKGTPVHFQ